MLLVVESPGPGAEAITTPKQLLAAIVKNRSGKDEKDVIGSRCGARLRRRQSGTPELAPRHGSRPVLA